MGCAPQQQLVCTRVGTRAAVAAVPVRPVHLKLKNSAPLYFKNGAKPEFEMCFGPSNLGAGARKVSRIQNTEVFATLCLQA